MTSPTAEGRNAVAKLIRDRSPEARALGQWSVEIETALRGYERCSTDYCQSPNAAMAAARMLALRLGVTLTRAA